MKKLTSILLTAAMLVTFPVSVNNSANNSANISAASAHTFTIEDVLNILKDLASLEKLTDEQVKLYDFFGDGKITIDNALEVLKYLAGLADCPNEFTEKIDMSKMPSVVTDGTLAFFSHFSSIESGHKALDIIKNKIWKYVYDEFPDTDMSSFKFEIRINRNETNNYDMINEYLFWVYYNDVLLNERCSFIIKVCDNGIMKMTGEFWENRLFENANNFISEDSVFEKIDMSKMPTVLESRYKFSLESKAALFNLISEKYPGVDFSGFTFDVFDYSCKIEDENKNKIGEEQIFSVSFNKVSLVFDKYNFVFREYNNGDSEFIGSIWENNLYKNAYKLNFDSITGKENSVFIFNEFSSGLPVYHQERYLGNFIPSGEPGECSVVVYCLEELKVAHKIEDYNYIHGNNTTSNSGVEYDVRLTLYIDVKSGEILEHFWAVSEILWDSFV